MYHFGTIVLSTLLASRPTTMVVHVESREGSTRRVHVPMPSSTTVEVDVLLQ